MAGNVFNLGSKLVLLNGLPMQLPIAASDPGSASAGDMYYNSGSNSIRFYDGSSWQDISGNTLVDLPLDENYIIVGDTDNESAAVDTAALGDILASDVGLEIKAGVIVNADINAAAAIAYSKLALSNSIMNADINSAAAIAYSKLNLSASIVNADVSPSAAIVYSKLSLSNSIVNADINASAAIAYSKLSLSNSIVNADVSSSAAIAYSKLNLSASIVNADISGSAAIAYSKLNLASSVKASDINSESATNGQVLAANGSGGASWVSAATGSVTSVALTAPSFLNVSGSPITSSGTLALTLTTQAANKVFAGPASGADAAPTFRSLVSDDIPSLSALYESVDNFAVRSYQAGISLDGSISSPTTIPELTFDVTVYGSMEMKYSLIDSGGARRQGSFMVASDGSVCGYSDHYAESAQIGDGVVFSAVMDDDDVLIQYTGTDNACTLRAEITKYLA